MQITPAKLKRFATDWGYARYVLATNLARTLEQWRGRLIGTAAPPKMVILQITGACNRTCRMCNQWGENGGYHGIPTNQLTLDLATIEDALAQVARHRPYIQILGGEPPLHPQFGEVLDAIERHALRASLETNGTTLDFWARRLVHGPVDTVNVSIDGPAELHDQIRGAKGTYRLAVKGIEKIFRLREEAGTANPAVNVRMTLTDENHARIVETVECFKDLPIAQFTIQHLLYDHPPLLEENARLLRPIKPGHQEIQVGGTLKPPAIDGELVWSQIETLREPGRYSFAVVPNPHYQKDYVRDYYRDASYLPDPGLICRIPQEVLSISCQGEATICSHFYVGRIREAPLMELWNSPMSREFRKLLARRGSIPACKICCYPTEE
ncbi:MAG: radical SAM protein [Candidatus Omnitrophica bacterium]|nr:7-carboxy-7-deazaguanine synthase [bacterium]NUN97907.1 radical SAM protein [Candidatus Omnitrophota bacterium]